MPVTAHIKVKDLKLDLQNFRTITQKNEIMAVHTMISINPGWFWALTESLLEDGYHPTENIIVLKSGEKCADLIVKEGNRRIGALKIIFGYIRKNNLPIPSHILSKIGEVTKAWKSANDKVPCAIYEPTEAASVDKIVTLIHGKGEKAGRDIWPTIARARHNRDKSGASEPALDLLEKYLTNGSNLTPQQSGRWSGTYPLSVLDEAIKRIATRFGVASSRELAQQYPKLKYKDELENVIRDIGLETLSFKNIRNTSEDFAESRYGIPATVSVSSPSTSASNASVPLSKTTAGPATGASASAKGGSSATKKPNAVSVNDPKSVMLALKRFTPKGNNREKLVALLDEARKLNLSKHPHSFCFILRSMFEISAKAYCIDHQSNGGPSATKANGDDRALVDVLRDIYQHITNNNADKQMAKLLHGAIAEIATPEKFLSVTSMNQLVHNPRFSINETHISALFGNIFPLLEVMNR